jgi:hypothetical protein
VPRPLVAEAGDPSPGETPKPTQWVYEPAVDAHGNPVPALVDVVMMFKL